MLVYKNDSTDALCCSASQICFLKVFLLFTEWILTEYVLGGSFLLLSDVHFVEHRLALNYYGMYDKGYMMMPIPAK